MGDSVTSPIREGPGRLALGTVQFGLPYGIANKHGQTSRREAAAIVAAARSGGVDTIDTATSYGESEYCLGEIGMDGLRVVTKIPSIPSGVSNVEAWIEAETRASLERLRIQQLEGVLLHRPLELLGSHGTALYKGLCALKGRGVARKVGISIYAPSELDQVLAKFPMDMVQAPLNVVDQRILLSGWAARLKERGIELHTRSAFLQGLLLLPRDHVPKRFERWRNLFGVWNDWLEEHGVRAAAACLALPLSQPEVDRVVVGTDTATQMHELLDAATMRISAKLPTLALDDQDLINPARW